MPWRDLLRQSHLPPPVIAECEAQPGSGGRPGRVNAATEATAAEPGLQPADPDSAAGAIAPNRSEVNRCRPERPGPEPRKDPASSLGCHAGTEQPGLKRCGGQTAKGVP